MTLRYLIEKEFKQLVRNAFLPRMLVVFPIMMMLVLPWAASMEVKNIRLAVVDDDHSPYSLRLLDKAAASDYFILEMAPGTFSQALEGVEKGDVDVILRIPQGFERDLVKEKQSRVLISSNAVNGSKGLLASSYLSSIVADFAAQVRSEIAVTGGQGPYIAPSSESLFNPHLDYKAFMIPALMVMLLTILCGFLPALNIVGEKEKGTIEQINVSPVGKFTFILAKLIPYWVVGLLILSVCFIIAAAVYGIVPRGHLYTIYFCACLFILVISGLGLVVSNYSSTMQQAMFVMYFFIMVLVMMSGLFTSVRSMPEWAQVIAGCNPLKYFIKAMRMVYLKGSGLSDLWPQILALSGFAVVLNGWAVRSYRKKS